MTQPTLGQPLAPSRGLMASISSWLQRDDDSDDDFVSASPKSRKTPFAICSVLVVLFVILGINQHSEPQNSDAIVMKRRGDSLDQDSWVDHVKQSKSYGTTSG